MVDRAILFKTNHWTSLVGRASASETIYVDSILGLVKPRIVSLEILIIF